MARALDPVGGEFTYVLEAEREFPEAEQTRWKLRPLNFSERLRVRDQEVWGIDDDGRPARKRCIFRQWVEAVQRGLLDAENLGGAPEGIASWRGKDGRYTEEALHRIEPYIEELGMEIVQRSALTEEQKKSS